MDLKNEAMTIKSDDPQQRYKMTSINKIKFRVMATTQKGFNVVLQNGDFTLSLRKIDDKNHNPVVKAEFRAGL